MAATVVFTLLVLISIVSAHGENGARGNFGQGPQGRGIYELYRMLNLSTAIISQLNNYTIAMDLTDFNSQINQYISQAANVTAAQNLYANVGPPASLITAVDQMNAAQQASYAGFIANKNFTALFEALKTLICSLPTTDQNQAMQFLFAAFRPRGGQRNSGGAPGGSFGRKFAAFGGGQGGFGGRQGGQGGFGGPQGGQGGFCNATTATTASTAV
jgi:hypothetical protein